MSSRDLTNAADSLHAMLDGGLLPSAAELRQLAELIADGARHLRQTETLLRRVSAAGTVPAPRLPACR